MTLNDALWITQMILRAIISVALIRVAISRPKMRSLRWLIVVFCINAVNGIFILSPVTAAFPSAGIVYNLGFMIVQLALVMFIHETFYQDRSSPYVVFLIATILVQVAAIGNSLKSPQAYSSIINPVNAVTLNWLWHAVIGYQAYKVIARDPLVENWVKARYLMMVAYSIIIIIPQFIALLGFVGIKTSIIGMPCVMISIVLQFLVWVMPESFRRWLNRNYRRPEGDEAGVSEEDLKRKFGLGA